jgi:hypothetical protein
MLQNRRGYVKVVNRRRTEVAVALICFRQHRIEAAVVVGLKKALLFKQLL